MSDFKLYLRSHGVLKAILGLVVAILLEVFSGSGRLTLPLSSIEFPFRSLIPIVGALAIMSVLVSENDSLEQASARGLRSLEIVLVFSLLLAYVAGLWLVSALNPAVGSAVVHARSAGVWTMFGLCGAYMFGARLSWILPIISIIPLTYFDPAENGEPAWWNWPVASSSASGSWFILGAVAVAALAACAADRWSIAFAKRRLLGRIRG